jgi:multidrug resistance efflux pump
MISVSIICCCLFLISGGCRSGVTGQATTQHQPSNSAASTPKNRVDIPPSVRKNLGITFAKAEVREVAHTIRAPGSFELSPESRREYRTMASGRIELHINQYEAVEPGRLLYTLDSRDWRELQQRLNESELQLEEAKASAGSMKPLIAARERHRAELEATVAIWTERVEQLEKGRETGVVSDEDFAQARALLATTRADLAEIMEKEAELLLREARIRARLNAHKERRELLFANASLLLSQPVDHLTETDPNSPERHPRWREIRTVDVLALAGGVVESVAVTNGTWADESTLVLTTVQPDKLRFRALGLQADLPRLANGVTARITPPLSSGIQIGDGVEAIARLGLDAHPNDRTITLIAKPKEVRSWMRPGVSAFLEVAVEDSGGKTLAIPRSAVLQDGLSHVYFRRDPNNPNKAIRVEADMGVDDGRWVVINSGLMRGDEVVLNGTYELKMATAQSGGAQKGGHFHADGSFHGEH